MKNIFLFRHIAAFSLAFTALNSNLNAQKPIDSHTDERYGNTTVVYKDTNLNDAALLAQLEKDFSMGDVVRITVAPPKPQPAPAVAPKTTPLAISGAAKPVTTPAIATQPVPSVVASKGATVAVAQKVKPIATKKVAPVGKAPVKAATPVHTVTPEPAIAPAPKVNQQLTASTDNPTLFLNSLTANNDTTADQTDAAVETAPVMPVRQVNTTAKLANTTTVSASKAASKTASKSGKSTTFYQHKRKSNFSVKAFMKKHKPGRQQYKCYKF